MSNESDNLYAPTFDEVRSLQDLYFGSSKSHYLSKEEEKKLYDSQEHKDFIGEGKYKNDLQDGIWTEYYECKFRDEKDLEIIRYKALLADVDKMIDEDPEYVKDEDEDEYVSELNWEFTFHDVLSFVLIKKRLREFNGCLKLVSNYVAGEKEFLSIGYGDNDEVKFKCHYRKDRREGSFIEWYENGQLKLESNYKDGELDGHFAQWFDDGERMLECDYKNGFTIGDPVIYNQERMTTRTGPKF